MIEGEGWGEGGKPDVDKEAADLAVLEAEKADFAQRDKGEAEKHYRTNCRGEQVEVHADDVPFIDKFMQNAKKVFKLIDLDDNGGMTMEEISESIAEEPEVVRFLWTCGNMDMQHMLDENRLPASFAKLDQVQCRRRSKEFSRVKKMYTFQISCFKPRSIEIRKQ